MTKHAWRKTVLCALLLGLSAAAHEGGNITKRVEPVFPKAYGREASIFVSGIVEKDGSFTNVHVFSPQGAAVEQAGKDAAGQWKFNPGMCDGHAIATESEVSITMTHL
jgi:hypothetical protein